MKRKPIQASVAVADGWTRIIVICDDGSIWEDEVEGVHGDSKQIDYSKLEWKRLPDIPQDD